MPATSPKWKLVRLGDKAEANGAAQSLVNAFGSPWQIGDLPKKVQINITSNPMEAIKGSDGDYDHSGWLVFKPNSSSIGGFEDVSGKKERLTDAWANSSISKIAIGNNSIVGDNK